MAIKIEPYQRQVMTPSVTVSDGRFRAPDLSAPAAALADAGHAVADLAVRQSIRRDELDLTEFERRLGEVDTEIMVGSDEAPGALHLRGVQAEGIRDTTLSAFDKRTKDMTPQLRTAEGRARAQKLIAVRREDASRRLAAHEFDQGRIADEQITTAALQGYQQEAIANATDPAMVDASIARMAAARAAYGNRIGEPPELTAIKITEQQSAVLKDVIARQLTQDSTAALTTFKANAERLIGQDALDVERALQPYVLDIQARSLARAAHQNAPATVAVGSASLYDAINLVESGGRHFDDAGRTVRGPVTASGERAVGGFQIMPSTGPEAARLAGERWDPARLENDPEYNARLGRAYLDAQVQRFGGNVALVAAAYNMGPAAAEKWAAGVPYQTASGKWWHPKAPMDLDAMPEETRKYVGKVQKHMGGEPVAGFAGDVRTIEGLDAREASALGRLNETIADPRLRSAAISETRMLYSLDRDALRERLRSAEVNNAEFTSHYANVVAKLSDGVDVPIAERPTEEQLRVVYGPAEGERRYREMNTYAEAAPAVRDLALATPSEAAEVLKRFKPNPRSDNYAFEEKVHEGMRTAWANAQKARSADPAQVLLTNSKAVAQQYQRVIDARTALLNAQTPEGRQVEAQNLAQRGQAYTDFMMAEQARLGVPHADRKLLPQAVVQRVVGEFDAKVAEGDVQGAANLVRATVGAFGDGASVAIRQMGDTAGPVLRMALEGVDTRTVETFIAGAREGDKALKDGIGNDAWAQMQQAVRESLGPLDATGSTEYGAYFDMAVKVAAMKVRAGLTPVEAAEQAAGELINDRYVFAGQGADAVSYRVPRYTPQGNPVDTSAVVRGAERVLANLQPDSFAIGEALAPDVPEDLYRKYRALRIQRTGEWRTLGDETGLELSYQDDAGRSIPVRRADGTPWRMTWAQLADLDARRKPVSVQTAAYQATLRGTR